MAALLECKTLGDAKSQTGSRGSWLGELLCQSLTEQCETPDDPPANQGPAALDDNV